MRVAEPVQRIFDVHKEGALLTGRPLRVYLIYVVPLSTINQMIEWCTQTFGSGSNGAFDSLRARWSIGRITLNTVFFQFQNERQRDWFMLRFSEFSLITNR